jgi:hypothetical protein
VDLSVVVDQSCKNAVCSILRFLKVLLRRGKKKKYFQSFEVIAESLDCTVKLQHSVQIPQLTFSSVL